MPEPHNSEGESNNVKGTNPKICDHCGSCFPSTSQLKRHIVWVHEGKIHKHQCYICGKSVKHLQEHISAVHDRLSGMLGKQLGCPFCSVISTTNRSLLDHVEL